MSGQQNQIKPVVDLVNAIFHGDARHACRSVKWTEYVGYGR
jgi:hypothetical protein